MAKECISLRDINSTALERDVRSLDYQFVLLFGAFSFFPIFFTKPLQMEGKPCRPCLASVTSGSRKNIIISDGPEKKKTLNPALLS